MPQATRELQIAWDHDAQMDGKALKHLRDRGFTFESGIIIPPDGETPTELDFSAIDYLCQEWDYGWEGCD
jgi:hypothetical protein